MSGSWKDITKETLRHYYCDKHMSDQQIGAAVQRNAQSGILQAAVLSYYAQGYAAGVQ